LNIFLEILISDIIPIFLVAFVGWLMASRYRIDVRIFSQVGVNALLPCLIFKTFSSSEVNLFESGKIALFCLLTVIGSGLLARLIAAWLRLNGRAILSLMLVVMFTNVGNFGLPVVTFAFGEQALTHATVYFVTMNILLYTVGVAMLSGGRMEWKRVMFGLLKEPVVISIVLAFFVSQLKIGLPTPILRSVDLLAQAAIPAMLLILGMRFFQSKIEWKPALWWAVALRLIIIPLAAFPLGYALQLSGPALQAGMLQAGTPAGVSTTLLATEYDIEPDFVNSVVFISTILCSVTLTPLIMIFRLYH
jgi:predicted permease